MDVHSGQVLAEPIDGKNDSINFCGFLADIYRVVDPNLEIHVVLDNGSSHRSKHTTAWFEEHPRWVVHFPPPHASWVNQVELFFSILQRKVIRGGRFDSRDDLVTKLLTMYPYAGTPDNLGSLSTGIAKIFPQDRFNFSTFQRDGIYSAFSYASFYPEIAAAESGVQRDTLLNKKWAPEVEKWVEGMKSTPNIGYYVPYQRDLLKSHTLTTLTFSGTAIKEANIKDLGKVVDNLIDGSGTPIRAYETQKNEQNTKTPGILDSMLQPIYKALGL